MAMRNKSGFTLAEVLITLTIIGVVAAMTIPALMNKITEIQYKIAWRKEYSNLAQATKLLANENGGSLANTFGDSLGDLDPYIELFMPQLRYTKICYQNTPLGLNGCWPDIDHYFLLGGQSFNDVGWDDFSYIPRLVLLDGASMMFQPLSLDCTGTEVDSKNECGTITTDINGLKPPNTIGKDVFRVHVLGDGSILPIGTKDNYYDSSTNKCNDSNICDTKVWADTTGFCCATDYLN